MKKIKLLFASVLVSAALLSTSAQTADEIITNYFEKRRQLVCAFVLVDSRHEPQKIDLEFMEWLGTNQIPFNIIFTKADKLKPEALKRNIKHYQEVLLESWEECPQHFVTSSSKRIGQEELLSYIGQINQNIK